MSVQTLIITLLMLTTLFVVGMDIGTEAAQSGSNMTVSEAHHDINDAEANVTESIESNWTGAVEKRVYAHIIRPTVNSGFTVAHTGVDVGAAHPGVATPASEVAPVGLAIGTIGYMLLLVRRARRHA